MATRVMTHRMIEAFRAAIVHGGISAGADALDMSQPSMSRLLSDLQRIVGFPLFMKVGRTMRPTDEALAMMIKVQQSFVGLEDIARFSDQLRKQKMGRLSICTIPSIGHSVMPEIIEHLHSKYPDVIVSLTVASYSEVARNVRNRQADIGFTADTLSMGGLETVATFTGDCVCIGTSAYLPSAMRVVSPADLLDKPFVGFTGTFEKRLNAWLTTEGQQLDSMVEASLAHSVSELVLRGMGISVVDPFSGVHHQRRGGITLPLRPSLPYTIYAAAMSDTRLSQPVRDLLHCVQSAIEKAATHSISG